MINSNNNITGVNQVPCESVFVTIFYRTVYDKTTIRFGFCDILNNQGLGKCYQPRPLARLITLVNHNLDYSGFYKNLQPITVWYCFMVVYVGCLGWEIFLLCGVQQG